MVPGDIAPVTVVKLRPKNERQAAFEKLGVKERDLARHPRITPQLRQMQRQMKRVAEQRQGDQTVLLANFATDPYYYLQSSDSPDARAVLERYYDVTKTARKSLPIEAFCIAAGVPPLRVLEVIVATAVRMNAQSSELIAAVSHPRVVEKTVEQALTADGVKDRETLHKHTGFLPTPRGPSVRVNVNANAASSASAAAQSVAAPPPEQTIRRLVDRFNDTRGILSREEPAALPEAVDASTPFPAIKDLEAEAVPVPAEGSVSAYDDDDPEEENDDY